MPNRHSVKTYVENGYYHIYNRGVEKRIIFQDDQDYRVFLHLLKYYLSPLDDKTEHPVVSAGINMVRPRPLSNLFGKAQLICYCLMPNHFHLLIKQVSKDSMTQLLRNISTSYSMYFNKRNNRVGGLFQGKYKAALIENDSYLLHLSRYIHANPIGLSKRLTGSDLVNYPYSSYAYFIGGKNAEWVNPQIILKFFENKNKFPFLLKYNSYKTFVEGGRSDAKEILGNLAIDY